MRIINASRIGEITDLANKHGYHCVELYALGDVSEPVILSDYTDASGAIANTLAVNGVPILYLAFEAPTNLSSKVHVLQGEFVKWKDIEAWIKSAFEQLADKEKTATLSVKKTIGMIGIQGGVGCHTIARSLAFESAKHRKTLYIDLNYRYPKAPFTIGLKDSRYSLNAYLENLLNDEKTDIFDYCHHKTKAENVTPKQKLHFKKLPDKLYVLAPDIDKMEYFPEINMGLDETTELVKKMMDNAKVHFDSVIISMSSDVDDVLNLAFLRATDNRFLVTDLNPSSVLSLNYRLELLKSLGILIDDIQVILNKLPEGMGYEVIESTIGKGIEHKVSYDKDMIMRLNALNLGGSEAFMDDIQHLETNVFVGKNVMREEPKKQKRFLFFKTANA